jgi:hypothetical protein
VTRKQHQTPTAVEENLLQRCRRFHRDFPLTALSPMPSVFLCVLCGKDFVFPASAVLRVSVVKIGFPDHGDHARSPDLLRTV